MDGGLLVVPAGSLDSELDKAPDGHIFISNKANWDNALEQVIRFDRFPEPDQVEPARDGVYNKPTIGILAGMGPRSTGPFLELVLDQCQKQYGAKDDIDYPQIMIYSLPTPFYIDREIDVNTLKKSVRTGLKRLEATGVDFIGIPCNSAHAYFDYITEESNVPVLNIVTETVSDLIGGSRVSLFATESTRKSGLYQNEIKDRACTFVFEDTWQETINEVILGIKNHADMLQVKQAWDGLISKAVQSGVEIIIIACTDLNVVLDKNRQDVAFIDSSEALAKGLVEAYIKANETCQ
jgi:aspartate racemase